MKLSIVLICLFGSTAVNAALPHAVIEPAAPKWGDRVALIYRQDAPGALLTTGQQIVARVIIWYPEHSEERLLKLQAGAGNPRAEFTVPESASFISAYFVTADAYDGSVTAKVYDAAGKEARGAWLNSTLQPSLQKDFLASIGKELRLYPDNWPAYRDKWFLAAFFVPTELQAMISADLAAIEHVQERPLGALYALSYAYLLQKREQAARTVIGEMVKRFPDAYLTHAAIDSYVYKAYADHFEGDGLKEVTAWQKAFYERNPNSKMVRDSLSSIGAGRDLSVATVEAICRAWMRDEPQNPWPYVQLMSSYRKAQVNGAEALILAEKALDLLAAGQMRCMETSTGE